jgi:CRISPR-associated protein Cas1
MLGWRVMVRALIVMGHGVRLRVKRRSLVVEEPGKPRETVPLAEIDRVVVGTSGVSLSSSAVRVLASYGISIVFLDARGQPMVSLEPPFISATSETRLAQYAARMDSTLRLGYAASFVQAKMLNQANMLYELALRLGERWLLDEAAKIQESAARAPSARSVEELRSLEAQAARRYWGAYATLLPPSLGFDGRDPDAGDPVNRSLNYMYGMLYAEGFRHLVIHGLDPYVGFMHADRSGKPSLVFDYVEMFRVSTVDKPLLHLLRGGWKPEVDPTGYLSREARLRLIRLFHENLERRVYDGSGTPDTLERHMSIYARRLARSLRSKTPYHGFVEAVKP